MHCIIFVFNSMISYVSSDEKNQIDQIAAVFMILVSQIFGFHSNNFT